MSRNSNSSWIASCVLRGLMAQRVHALPKRAHDQQPSLPRLQWQHAKRARYERGRAVQRGVARPIRPRPRTARLTIID
eukprot:3184249-Pleurochrysis_carterae.AAC.6